MSNNMKHIESSLDVQREALISAAIPFVLSHGWSEKALSESCISLSEDPQYWGVFFSNISDVVDFFEKSEDARMIRVMVEYGEIEGFRNKIGKALFERIVNIAGGARMLKRLEEFYLGIHAPLAAKNIWQTADIIWLFAGDKSTDFNHYTKRTLLSGVYVATVRHVLGRESVILEAASRFGDLRTYPRTKDEIPELRSRMTSNARDDNSEIQQYISDALDSVVKFGSFKKYLKLPKMEDIPILRMFS